MSLLRSRLQSCLLCLLLASPFLLPLSAARAQSPLDHDRGRRPAQPVDAVDAVLGALEGHALVAMGEAHGLLQQHEMLQRLLRHPGLPARVDDIVVEFGNARYQPLLDRYIAGEEVSLADLQVVWRDHSVSPMQPWDGPLYQRFFETVRDVNRGLPPDARLRVIAGDPPIDWSAVTTRGEVFAWRMQRAAHMADVVGRDVLSRGRRGLLIAGTLHLVKRSAQMPGTPAVKNALQLIEEQFPGSAFVMAPHTGFGAGTSDIEQGLSHWSRPAAAAIPGTWLSVLPGRMLFPDVVLAGPPGSTPPDPWAGLTFEDLIDAYLYFGPRETLTLAVPSPLLMRDDAYFAELNRRSLIVRGVPLAATPQFYAYGFPPPPGPAPLP